MNELKQPTYSIYAEQLLSSHQFQGQTNDCGPFCAAMIMHGIKGTPVLGSQIADDLNQRASNELLPILNRIPNSATFPWGITRVFRRAGIEADWRPFYTTQRLIQDLQKNILPITIIGGYKPAFWAHYTLLVAYDPHEGWGFCDPAYDGQKITWHAHDDFLKLWKALGHLVVRVKPGPSNAA